MLIVIPTFMRETRQIAYNHLPKELKLQTVLVTHSGRAELLRKENPGAKVHDLGVTDGIADVRQKIVDWASKSNDQIFMMDDGCHFYTSVSDGEKRKIAPTAFKGQDGLKHYRSMLEDMLEHLQGHAQVGISPRPGNNRNLNDTVSPGRVYSCCALDLVMLKQMKARYDGMYQKNKQIKLFEDFYLTLHLLTRGVSNVILYNWGFMHDHGKGGGNSTIRNNDLQKLCLEALQQEFPDYVKIVQRKATSWNVGNPEFRWECIISWKKALTEAVNK